PEEIRHLQGASVQYWRGAVPAGQAARTGKVAAIAANWPQDSGLALPFVAQFEATLYAPRYGQYGFLLKAPGRCAMWIDEKEVLKGEREQSVMLKLAQGDHTLRVRAVGGHGALSLQWQEPDSEGQATGKVSQIPSNSLYLSSLVPAQ